MNDRATRRQIEQEPRTGLTAVLIIGWGVGVLMGGFGVTVMQPDRTVTIPAADTRTYQLWTPEIVVKLNAILQIPTEFPTEFPTEVPTVKPTRAATVVVKLNWCGTATPGTTCQQPPAPTSTPEPLPDCATAGPGQWCVWATEVST